MAIYPKRIIPKAQGGMGFNLSNLTNDKGGLNPGISGIATAGADLAFGKTMKTDERGFQTARSTGNYMGRNALKGAAMGAQFGGIGAAVGAGIGAISGVFQAGKLKKEANNHNRILTESNERDLRRGGNATFHNNLSSVSNSLYRKGGRMFPGRTRMFSGGGVILGGEGHENEGNLIVDQNNNPVAETESEELMLSIEQTEALNKMFEVVDQKPDDMRFAELGRYFAEKILPNVTDNSGKFGMNKATLKNDAL